MKLSDYISSLLASSSPNLRKQRRKVQLSLQAYYGPRYADVSLLDLALPERITGYITFLTDTYQGGQASSLRGQSEEPSKPQSQGGQGSLLSKATSSMTSLQNSANRAATHITILRGILNTAIQRGLFPQIDPFADHPDYRRRQALTPDVPLTSALPRLAAAIGVPAVKAYIASLALGGIDIAKVGSLLGCDASNPAGKMPALLDSPAAPLLDSLRDIAADHPDWLPGLTTRAIAANLAAHGIHCLAAGDIFTDWCVLATQAQLVTPAQLAAVIRCHLYPKEGSAHACENAQEASNDDQTLAAEAIARVAAHLIARTVAPEAVQRQHWAVVCANWPNTAERIENRILHNDTLAPLLAGSIYCPCHTPASRPGTPRPTPDPYRATLRSTLFVRATDANLLQLRRHIPDLWIMRRRHAATYTRIPPAQLDLMRRVLDLIGRPDDISIDLGDTPTPLEPLSKDELVRFTHPFFGDNITATVLGRVKNDELRMTSTNDELRMTNDENTSSSAALYKVQFTSMGKTITLTLPRILLTQI